LSSAPSISAGTFRGLPHAFWILIGGMFVNRLGSFVLPFLAVYLGEQQGLAARESGLVIGAWGVGSVGAALVGGQLADRWGRKRSMLASLFGGACVLCVFPQAHGFFALASLALCLGAVAEIYRPAVAAAITDLTAAEHRARAFGYLTWSYNLGFAVSPVLAGAIAQGLGFRWLFYGDAVTMFAAALVIAAWVSETRKPGDVQDKGDSSGYGPALRDPKLRPMLVAAVAIGLTIVQFIAALGPLMRTDGIDVALYGRIVALNGLLIVLTQPWLVPRVERLGARRVLPVCALLFCWGIGVHAFVDAPLAHACVVSVWTAGEVALFPLCNALVANLAPERLRGRYQGLYWMGWSSANVVGPSLGQELLERFGSRGWAALPFTCGAVAVAALLVATKRADAAATTARA
jgi:MFS family permease